jgi:uncharacterized protein (DUF486 family)
MSSIASVLAHPALACAVLLTLSNLFMTFAWYGHLKHLQASPWWVAALASWGVALFEYLLQVPANRIGYTTLSLGQLKILQEVITPLVLCRSRRSTWPAAQTGLPVGGALPAGRRLLHLPRLTASDAAVPNDRYRRTPVCAPVSGIRSGLPAVVSLPLGQRGHFARVDPRARADAGLARSADERVLRRLAAVQIPAGMLLDRYGPRRVEPVLLAVAATGALLFAIAEDVPGLVIARALIGAGCAACLMAPLKWIVTEYPVARQPSLSGWVMVAGGVGALIATTPLEVALRYVPWRTIFVALAVTAYAVAAWIWMNIPTASTPTRRASRNSGPA